MKSKFIATDKNNLFSYVKYHLKKNEIFLAFISGLFLFFSFPKYGFGFMAWIALVPLFFAIKKSVSLRQAITSGFVTGIVAYIGIIYWVTYVVVNYGYLPIYIGIIVMLLLAFYLSIYIALFAAGIYFFKKDITICLIAPALWVCFEYLKSYLFTGFPWENLGYSQYLNLYFIQFADIFGVFGLSFIIVAVNAAIFTLLNKKTKNAFIVTVSVFCILCVVYFYGYMRIESLQRDIKNANGIEVSLIQGNIDQSVKWNEFYQKEILSTYEEISLNRRPFKGGLLVWPETALPFNFQQKSELQGKVLDLPKKISSWFVFGAVSYMPKKRNTDFFNSAYFLSPQGEVKGKYDKVHLVPYGEYVPMKNIFPFISKLTAGIGDFSSGKEYRPLIMEDKKIGVLICYEGILPDAARMYKNQSTDLLVNITNDAWFGPTSAPYQHFSMALFRTIETRLYLVRAANTGISGIVDPLGKIISRTKIFETGALKGEIKFINKNTFYAKHGDVFVVVCFLFICFIFLWHWKRRF